MRASNNACMTCQLRTDRDMNAPGVDCPYYSLRRAPIQCVRGRREAL